MRFERREIFGRLTWIIFFSCVCQNFIAAQTKTAAKNQTVERNLTEISEAVSLNDLTRAKTILQKLLTAAPRNATAQTFAGVIADREKNLTTAEKHFALAARLKPNSPETRNNYGAILLKLGRSAAAAKEFEASLAINPNQPSALVNLSQIRFAENMPATFRQAEDLLNKAKQIAPDAEILRALVAVNLRLGEKTEAATNYSIYSALRQTSGAAADIELGSTLMSGGLFKEAVEELEAAVKSDSSDIAALTNLARAYLGLKDIKSAGRLLESAVARGVDSARIYAALAEVYTAGGFYENAIPAMRLAIERDRQSEEYRFRYGLLLVDTKAPAAAVIRLTEAVKEFPRSARIWLALGIAQFNDSKTVEARQSVEKALEFDARLVPAIAYLAAIEDETGKSVEAASNYERALALDEKNAALNYLLADALLKNAASDPSHIEKYLRRAIELDNSLAAAHLTLGRLYARQKRFAEAATELEKTVEFQPDRAEAYYQLGQIYVRLKRADESRAALAKFKQLSELEKKQSETDRRELVRRLANVKF